MKGLIQAVIVVICGLQASGAFSGEVTIAARSGDVDALRGLLDSGAPADEPGVATPLYFAAQSGHIDAVRLLLDHGADPNAVSTLGTPLMIAARRKKTDIVNLLISHGADVNLAGGEDVRTPLHEAAYMGAMDIVEILLEQGADTHARTRFGEPPVHEAKKKQRDAVAELLVTRTAWMPPPAPTEADISALDLEAGRVAVLECTGCHALEPDKAKEGPTLWAVFGRPKAGLDGYPYSAAMRADAGVWGVAALDAFLSDPMMAVPGTSMDRASVADQKERWAIIAYLMSLQ